MKPILEVPVNCERLGPVRLETRNWYVEGRGADERIHFHANCACGNEHVGFGFTPESLALSHPA